MAGGTRWVGAAVLVVLLGLSLVLGDAEAKQQATPRPVAQTASIEVTGNVPAGMLRSLRHETHTGRKMRHCDLRSRDGDMSPVPALTVVMTTAGNLIPVSALTCLRRPA